MTKVKTILAEFCTAKDILAINRLGLLAKEERESQPIPWRHRLPIKERRELVRSELRMSARPLTHTSKKEVTRALSSARTVKDSKLGECLLTNQTRGDNCLEFSLRGISGEQRRSESQMKQLKKSFLRQSACLNHEPMILVERPASPKVKSRASFKEKHGVDPIVCTMPSYMRPLESRSRTPSTLTTIEAFTVETKRKKNVWEEVVEDREEHKFKSTSRPSARLTEYEKKQLKFGHSLHKPTQESITSLAENKSADDLTDEAPASSSSSIFQPVAENKRKNGITSLRKHSAEASQRHEELPQRPESIAEEIVFVTQMSRKELEKGTKGRLKSVTFSDVTDASPKKSKKASNRKLLSLQEKGDVRRRLERQEGLGLDITTVKSVSKNDHGLKDKGKSARLSSVEREKKAKHFFSVILNHDH